MPRHVELSRDNLFGTKGTRIPGPPIARMLWLVSLLALSIGLGLTFVIAKRNANAWSEKVAAQLGRQIVFELQTQLPRAQAAFRQQHRGHGGEDAFRALAVDILRSHEEVLAVAYFTAEGRLIVRQTRTPLSPEQRQIISLEFPKVLPAETLQTRRTAKLDTRIDGTHLHLIGTIEEAVERDVLTPRLGFFRILANASAIQEFAARSVWVSVLSAGVFLLFLASAISFMVKRTVVAPLERSIRFLREGINDIYTVPKIRVRKTDALEVRRLINSLRTGLFEMGFRHRSRDLFEDTRRVFDDYSEESYLHHCRDAWIRCGLARKCQLLVARFQSASGQFIVERSTQSSDEDGNNTTRMKTRTGHTTVFRPDAPGGMLDSTIFDFLASGEETQWSKNILRAKVALVGPMQGVYFVLSIIPVADTAMDRFEELSSTWLETLARLHQNVHYQSLTRKLDLARELHRKWSTVLLSQGNQGEYDFDEVYAADFIPSFQVDGDLLFTCRIPGSHASLTLIGDVTTDEDNRIRAGLLAAELTAVLIHTLQTASRESTGATLLKELLAAANRFIVTVYAGRASLACLGLYFEHDTGSGVSICRGLRSPLLLTPHERKPMSVAPSSADTEPLGVNANPNLDHHEFNLFPGQILVAFTDGFFNAIGTEDTTFERAVRTGALSETTNLFFMESAKMLLIKFTEVLNRFVGDKPLEDDLTGVVLKRKMKSGDF